MTWGLLRVSSTNPVGIQPLADSGHVRPNPKSPSAVHQPLLRGSSASGVWFIRDRRDRVRRTRLTASSTASNVRPDDHGSAAPGDEATDGRAGAELGWARLSAGCAVGLRGTCAPSPAMEGRSLCLAAAAPAHAASWPSECPGPAVARSEWPLQPRRLGGWHPCPR